MKKDGGGNIYLPLLLQSNIGPLDLIYVYKYGGTTMGSLLETVTDDWLGLDPNGGGIYDIPVIGDIVDDQLGFDPNESPLDHLLTLAGWATAGTIGAGFAGVGPAAGTIEAIKGGASLTEILPSWGSLTGAEQNAIGSKIATESGGAIAAGDVLNAGSKGISVLNAAKESGSVDKDPGFWGTVGNIANAAGGIAGAVGAGAELYDAVTGKGAEADRAYSRSTVADVAPLTADQIYAQKLSKEVAEDPRLQQSVDQQYDAANLGSGALTTGIDTLSGIATGDDAFTNRLASQAASASDLGASQLGALGSARANRAKQTAAADVIAKRQQSAANTLASRGQGLLGQGTDAYNLSLKPAQAYGAAGTQQQEQAQNILNQEAAKQAATEGRAPTTAERIGAVGSGLQTLPTVVDQTKQGVSGLLDLFA